MTGRRFDDAVGGPPREPESDLTQREMDLARSVQDVTDEAMLKMARFAHAETGMTHLCLAGGVALNCVANGRLLREGPFEEIWIQPAAGDAGGAVGVALALWHRYLGKPRASAERAGTWEPNKAWRATHRPGDLPPYRRRHEGRVPRPGVPDAEIERFLGERKAPYRRVAPRGAAAASSPTCWPSEKVVGLLQGRMEFGPRALGGRSILGDAALAEDAVGDEPQDQVPRELPAVRAVACCASTCTSGSSSTATRPTCCWSADVREGPPARDDGRGGAALGDRQAERAALGASRR